MQPTDSLYYEYAGVISSVVNSYAKSCPDIADDLMLQAQLVFCQACLSYDPNHPSHATFETWLRRQLESITSIIKKASRGPSAIKENNQSAVPECMLSCAEHNGDEDKDWDISYATDSAYIHDYCKNLNEMESDFPKEMLPYINALKGDSLKIFQDFCAGKFELPHADFMTIAKQRDREYLNPIRIYRRVYIHEGWSLDRVRSAWNGLTGIFKSYIKGQLPTTLITSNRETKKPKTSHEKWLDKFRETYGITWAVYNRMRKNALENETALEQVLLPLECVSA